jgi:hypothetical protein
VAEDAQLILLHLVVVDPVVAWWNQPCFRAGVIEFRGPEKISRNEAIVIAERITNGMMTAHAAASDPARNTVTGQAQRQG